MKYSCKIQNKLLLMVFLQMIREPNPSPTPNLTLTLIYRKLGTVIWEYVVFQELAVAVIKIPAC